MEAGGHRSSAIPLCISTLRCHTARVWQSAVNFQESILSFHQAGS